jgi:hypothetical protein
MNLQTVLRQLVAPLQSRKVRVAIATVIAAYLVEFGFNVSPEVILTILGVGAALILGIAQEDAGHKLGRWLGNPTRPPGAQSPPRSSARP